MAENSDGLAIVNTNDLREPAQRLAADLSSYYLLGYQSTNPKLDGRFRSIKVTVKRPGVQVRARRGYRFVGPVTPPAPEEAVPAPPRAAVPPLVPSHLVGREAEFQALQGWRERAVQGMRQVVFVTGESGVGKTTFVDQFLQQVTAEGRCEPVGQRR